MILRPWKRLRQLERKLGDVELVVEALVPPRAGATKPPATQTFLRASLLKLAEATIYLDQVDEIARGACSVRLERKATR